MSSTCHTRRGLPRRDRGNHAGRDAESNSQALGNALRDNTLTPAAASRLAGKLAFLTQATFGAVGKAALQPLYSRSHDTSPNTTDELSDGGPERHPRHAAGHPAAILAVPSSGDGPGGDLCGRLRQDREQEYKAGHIPAGTPLPRHARDDNGWGLWCELLLLREDDQEGARPADVQDALNLFAQLMAVFLLAGRLPREWVAFIDNTAGEAALRKGYGMLSVFWNTAARRGQTRVQGQRRRRRVAGGPHQGLPRGLAAHGRQRRQGCGDPHLGGLRPRVRRAPRCRHGAGGRAPGGLKVRPRPSPTVLRRRTAGPCALCAFRQNSPQCSAYARV